MREHSKSHGWEVATNYFYQQKLALLKKSNPQGRKRPLTEEDLQLIHIHCSAEATSSGLMVLCFRRRAARNMTCFFSWQATTIQEQQMVEWLEGCIDEKHSWACVPCPYAATPHTPSQIRVASLRCVELWHRDEVDCVPTALEMKMPALIDSELAKFPVTVQPSPEIGGRGVFATQGIPEGDLIMEANCLLFTDAWLAHVGRRVCVCKTANSGRGNNMRPYNRAASSL